MSGFSVFQPTIGAALQWLPALGTNELEEMIHAVIPGAASIADKRAHIAMDFFGFSQQTGGNFKFYPVPATVASTATSPAGSAALHDSGYGSSFTASPVVSDKAPWTPATTAYTPSVAAEEPKPKPASHVAASRKSTASSSKQADFSNHPGMRIMTKDGRDVTNSASRGCKTKEQRDHAHLMRIIKACDACKRKKIRCDPSHKKRSASSPSQQETKPARPAKKAKKSSSPIPTPAWDMPNFPISNAHDELKASAFTAEYPQEEDLWSQFVAFDQEPTTLVTDFNPDDYDFSDSFDFAVPDFLTPNTSTASTSPTQNYTPFTPAAAGPSPPAVTSESLVDVPQGLDLPYLTSGLGSNYADFNLYSPPADFFLDEEPLSAKKALASGTTEVQSPQQIGGADAYPALHQPTAQDTFVATTSEYYSSLSPLASDAFHNQGYQSGVRRLDEYRYATYPVLPPRPLSDDGQHPSQPQENAGIHGPDARGAMQPRPQIPTDAGTISPTQLYRPNGRGTARPAATSPTVVLGLSESSIRSDPAALASRGLARRSGVDQPADDHNDPSIQPTSSPTSSRPSRPSRPSSSLSPAVIVQGTLRRHSDVQHSWTSGQEARSVGQQELRIVGRGRHTGSANAFATMHPSGARDELTVPGLNDHSHVHMSPGVNSLGQQAHATSPAPLLVVSSHLDGRTAVGMLETGINAQTLTAVLATVLPTTSPMRRRVDGERGNKGQTSSPIALFQLAVFGLISYLLVLAMQNNLLGAHGSLYGCLNVLAITSTTYASMHQKYTRSLEAKSPPRRPTSLSVPISTSTIDNVETKIQAMGHKVTGLGCFVSQQLRATLPRLKSLNSIMF